jgi:hypothetical protein
MRRSSIARQKMTASVRRAYRLRNSYRTPPLSTHQGHSLDIAARICRTWRIPKTARRPRTGCFAGSRSRRGPSSRAPRRSLNMSIRRTAKRSYCKGGRAGHVARPAIRRRHAGSSRGLLTHHRLDAPLRRAPQERRCRILKLDHPAFIHQLIEIERGLQSTQRQKPS